MLEAIELCQEIAGRELDWRSRRGQPRSATTAGGSATSTPFRRDYPGWGITHDVARHPRADPRAQCRAVDRAPREALGRDPRPQRGRVDRRDGASPRRGACSRGAFRTRFSSWTTPAATARRAGRARSQRSIRACAACARPAPRVSARPCAPVWSTTAATPWRSSWRICRTRPSDLVALLPGARGGFRLRLRIALHARRARQRLPDGSSWRSTAS